MERLAALLLACPLLSAPAAVQGTPASAQDPIPSETVMAKVGEVAITLADLKAEMNRIIPLTFFHARMPEEKRVETTQQALDSLVEKALIYQDAKQRGLGVTAAELRAEFRKTLEKAGPQYAEITEAQFEELLGSYREMVVRRVLLDKNEARFEASLPEITEEELRQRYRDHQDELLTPEEARFLHILVKVPPASPRTEAAEIREKADAALVRIRAGEDFGTVAREVSEDIYAENGGDMGFVTPGSIRFAEVNQAAFALADGATSEVLISLSGFHIVRRVESKPRLPLTFEQAKDELRTILSLARKEAERAAWIEALQDEFGVAIYLDLKAAAGEAAVPASGGHRG